MNCRRISPESAREFLVNPCKLLMKWWARQNSNL
jgi:hypothetical protein